MQIKCYGGSKETNLIPTKAVREVFRNVSFRIGFENHAAFDIWRGVRAERCYPRMRK